MKRVLQGLFCLCAGMVLFAGSIQAGGPIGFTREEIYAKNYESYLSCSCDSGSAEMEFHNHDEIPLTIKGSGWQVGPIQPGSFDTHTFTDPGEYPYTIAEFPSVGSKIIILDKSPVFNDDAKIITSNITSNSVTLSWPPATDDKGIRTYKIHTYDTLYTNEKLVYEGMATTATISDLKENTSYNFLVEGYDDSNKEPHLRPGARLTITVTTAKSVATETKKTTAAAPIAKASSTPKVTQSPLPTSSSTVMPATPSSSLDTQASVLKVNGKVIDPNVSYLLNAKTLNITGISLSKSKLIITVYSTVKTYETVTDQAGNWKVAIDTTELEPGNHRVTATVETEGVRQDEVTILQFRKAASKPPLVFIVALGAMVSAVVIGLLIIWKRKHQRAMQQLPTSSH